MGVWDFTLSNGRAAGVVLVEAHERHEELHLVHGLAAGDPLEVAQNSRTAGVVDQAITEAGGTVTVERVP